jgi:hypothetical protein
MTDEAGRGADGTHPLAVAALVTGILGLVPVSVACAAVSLSRLRGSTRPGRAQAFAGLVVSGLWVLVALAVAAVLIVRAATGPSPSDTSAAGAGAPGAGPAAPSSGPPSAPAGTPAVPRQLIPSIAPPRVDVAIRLSRGDCIVEIPTSGRIDGIVLTECTRPHQAQVGATFSPSGGGFPGDARLSTIARSQCPERVRKAIRPGAPALVMLNLIPEKSEWDGGDHSIKCLLEAGNGRPLTSSVVT